uniref:Putative ovule protein n=1 Tax=Solanum chacoense TaxID=4108 RepID=A0A0V0HF52_SOLCH
MYHVLCNHLSPILLQSTSTSLESFHSHHLTPLHWGIQTFALQNARIIIVSLPASCLPPKPLLP